MTGLLISAIVVVSVIAVMISLGVLAVWIRRRGAAGPAIAAAMAAYDEAMHATAHDTFVEVQEQRDRKVSIPSPGDPKRSTV
jgi:hypothetical protein